VGRAAGSDRRGGLAGYRQIFEPVRMLEALLILSVIKSALIIAYFMHLKLRKL